MKLAPETVPYGSVAIGSILSIVIVMIVIVVNWVWVKPKRLERCLREQNLKGNSYKLLSGDLKEMGKMIKEAKSKPMNLVDDVIPRVLPFHHQMIQNYGKNTFMWCGPRPSLIIMDPEQIKNLLNRNYDFQKSAISPIVNYISSGLGLLEGDNWAKHRKIINPAFHLEKLKVLLPTFAQSCNDMINKWEKMLSSSDGTCEVDVLPWLRNLTMDVISRAAFGSSYEEGRQIFELLEEQTKLVLKTVAKSHIPFWVLVPTKTHRKIKEMNRTIEASLKGIIDKKEKDMKAGLAMKDDLLGILLQSNHQEIEDLGNKKNVGLSIQDVIDECKVFYFAGQESTSTLLAWTMMLLSRYPDWQARAREEVLQVFGEQNPNFDELSRLKIVTMIMYEVLRLYPPVATLKRRAIEDMKLGNLSVPAGVELFIPILMVHHDQEMWGDDAKEFKPERFSEGISNAGKGASAAYFPFGWGPRICIGQNFALLKAMMALSLILQRFWFDLSPTYSHAPTVSITLEPQHGVHVILCEL